MYIGKLNKYCLVDIVNDNDKNTYLYLLQSKRFFKKLDWKLTFISELPFYLFTDISKVFINEGYFFEDLIDRDIKISIGTINVRRFTKEDNDLYSNNYSLWHSNYFDKAIDKQQKLKKDYEDKFGYPQDLGLHEAWKNVDGLIDKNNQLGDEKKLTMDKFVDSSLGVKGYASSIIKGDNRQVKAVTQYFEDKEHLWDGDFILTIGKNAVILTRNKEPIIVKKWKRLDIEQYLDESNSTSYRLSGVKIAEVYEDDDGWIWVGKVYADGNYFNITFNNKIIYEISFL